MISFEPQVDWLMKAAGEIRLREEIGGLKNKIFEALFWLQKIIEKEPQGTLGSDYTASEGRLKRFRYQYLMILSDP